MIIELYLRTFEVVLVVVIRIFDGLRHNTLKVSTVYVALNLNSIPQQFKGFQTYSALLNCYGREKSVEKAEAIMQKVKDMGLARNPLCYNFMMNMLSAYAAVGDSDGMDKIARMLESDKRITLDWNAYSIIAEK
ncbi:hypothetical protein KY289_005192 [Solanum tuberosum]|nr:hypothetical protein KY289_005192 [Solanum tuberosum]